MQSLFAQTYSNLEEILGDGGERGITASVPFLWYAGLHLNCHQTALSCPKRCKTLKVASADKLGENTSFVP